MGQAILIVRDRLGLTAGLDEALKAAGFGGQIVWADDTSRAAAMFEKGRFAGGELPAMVILPPLATSFVLLETLRKHPRAREVPVFVVRSLPLEAP